MGSGVFRGKESSNRIELSQLVQDLLNFGDLGSLQLWGWVDGGVGVGVPHTHMHMHTHVHTYTYTCMHTHTYTYKEIANGHQQFYHDCDVFPIIPMFYLSFLCPPCHTHVIPVVPTSFSNPHLSPHPPLPHRTVEMPGNSTKSIKLE